MTEPLPQTITVVIPTKNAAGLLEDCLESVSWADEIIVIDMFSEDETAEICERYPQCRRIERTGYIFANVNHGFEQATGDWVMRLDTDERITDELASEIQGILAGRGRADVTGYSFWERPVILGRELQHGFGRRHHRQMMFRRGAARYPVESEHEALETSGRWLDTRNGYLHLNYTSVGQYLRKTDYYTERDAERADLDAEPRMREAVINPLRAFWLYYLKHRGYRDGWVGLVDAGMRAIYQFTYWAKLRERWEGQRGS